MGSLPSGIGSAAAACSSLIFPAAFCADLALLARPLAFLLPIEQASKRGLGLD